MEVSSGGGWIKCIDHCQFLNVSTKEWIRKVEYFTGD